MNVQQLKKRAAAKALEFVQDDMRLGIGTGSTANEFIRLLGERVADGLRVTGVATSQYSEQLCRKFGVPVTTLEQMPELDLDIDGADEIGPEMTLIKGGGGALWREKIVAAASRAMLVIADETKVVKTLGAFALPIEVNPFGMPATRRLIEKVADDLGLSGEIILRMNGENPFKTDGGHFIFDAFWGCILQPRLLSEALLAIPGVVEHGLFWGLASRAIVAMADGQIKVLESSDF
ncbi:ribose-5-phosphate isomerase RpiA [Bartonella quintana]|uniref:Ribose-5-phosphate isomerase A n=1 Tax=Bartonella quintana (strain Toulouse) TaxID=283165 RepID=RPIA_BARQU|nr:ribose-5-phosphate isomerase RpiA [Bartonella quintana]Q6FZP1.1 RecName: Full=Ribose-5-phosphate isomerase A; AltName: Full=Phosphoriboisomerase A; Short=PRI [Bartonella quintana str. Toulouse]AFR26372.1 ribose-5-phosphate isomerase A [Bartonella quintana RM-11]KEC59835.1 ribose-5-phosphate isomerase A [Bartonella quintana JK 19]KEC68368.1 ribose-5-phosphate isomerase A [Bartonella quintana JK 39]CAF26171.1 Ribose 5-phosphate isomerase [Bartonella quintana str. Toulouse]SQF95684.1 Ribose-5